MDYQQAVDWLFTRFPAYQNIGAPAYKPDLTNVRLLLEALDHPDESLHFVHIAGTNGKGSTSHILAAICQCHGFTTGIFTSPHLVDFRERIKVNGEQISEQKVVDWVERVIPALQIHFEPSFFELTFALALSHFKESACDICIIETGLGGRLDATNVITPLLSIITNIGLDHQNFLGDTRKLIASEKAGIIKYETPILIAEKDEETRLIFEQKVSKEKALLRWVDLSQKIESDLLARYQQLNLNTAKQAFEWLCEINTKQIDNEKTKYALKNVAKITDFRGRMELIQDYPKVIFDVAHNSSGIQVLLNELNFLTFENLHIVFGSSNDKDIKEIIHILPQDASYYFTEFSNYRSRKAEEWNKIGNTYFNNYQVFEKPINALESAKLKSHKQDLILVFGSFFLIGELY